MNFTELYPGITLQSICDKRFKFDYLSLNFLFDAQKDCRALREILPGVLKHGTGKHPDPASLNKALEDAYDASLSIKSYGKAGVDVLSFTVSFLGEEYLPEDYPVRDAVLSLLFEAVTQPLTQKGVFLKKVTENEKRNLIDGLKAEKNNKVRYAIRKCIGMLCPDSYLAKSYEEKVEEIEKVSPEGLYSFYRSILEKARIEIFFIGSSSTEQLSEDLKNRLAPLAVPKCAIKRDLHPLPATCKRKEREPADANQSVLVMGFKTCITPDHPDFPAFTLMREILADSPVSLLFMNVREEQNLCYFCDMSSDPAKGLYIIYCGIDKKNRDAAERAILEQVEKMKRGDFTKEGYESALKARISRYRSVNDSQCAKEGWYLDNLLHGSNTSVEEAINTLKQMTKEDVMRAANSLEEDAIFFLEAKGRENGQ